MYIYCFRLQNTIRYKKCNFSNKKYDRYEKECQNAIFFVQIKCENFLLTHCIIRCILLF